MTEKRLYDVIDKAEPRGQSVTYEGIPCTARTCVTQLNKLTEENEQLKIKLEDIALDMENAKESNDDAQYELYKIKKENEKLKKEKERYKRLSEIRREEINNRILTIKEFINNCSDKKVRNVLKDLFYSEVNEYDLSSENRKLLNENEQLKQQLSSINQLIDNKIDEFKNGDYGDLPCNTIHMFLDLKQEIGDVE